MLQIQALSAIFDIQIVTFRSVARVIGNGFSDNSITFDMTSFLIFHSNINQYLVGLYEIVPALVAQWSSGPTAFHYNTN